MKDWKSQRRIHPNRRGRVFYQSKGSHAFKHNHVDKLFTATGYPLPINKLLEVKIGAYLKIFARVLFLFDIFFRLPPIQCCQEIFSFDSFQCLKIQNWNAISVIEFTNLTTKADEKYVFSPSQRNSDFPSLNKFVDCCGNLACWPSCKQIRVSNCCWHKKFGLLPDNFPFLALKTWMDFLIVSSEVPGGKSVTNFFTSIWTSYVLIMNITVYTIMFKLRTS